MNIAFQNSDAVSREHLCAFYQKVFADSEGIGEGQRIARLVQDLLDTSDEGDLVGFVAMENRELVSAVLFSKLTFESPVAAMILSPMAVDRDMQRQGVGKALIEYGLAQLSDIDVDIVFVYGDPAYYGKFGFAQITEEIARAPAKMSMPFGWQALTLDGRALEPIAGASTCLPALARPEYW
jgi:putative acetyltransferase